MSAISERAVFTLGVVGLSTRLFYALSIDGIALINAGWLSAIGACLILLPFCFCLHFIEGKQAMPPAQSLGNGWGRAFCAVLCLCSLFEAGCSMQLLGGSAEYVALQNIGRTYLSIVCALVAIVACLKGAEAVAGTARVWLWIALPLLIIILLSELHAYNPRWLTPVLGPGVGELLKGSVVGAGLLTSIVPLWLLKGHHHRAWKRFSLPMMIGAIALTTVVLMGMFLMLMPPMVDASTARSFRLDWLLTNGRTPLSLQFVLVPVWFGSLMVSLLLPLLCACSALMVTFPGITRRWAVAICALIALVIPILNLASRELIGLASFIRLPLVLLPVLVYTLIVAIQSRKKEVPS